MTNPRHQFVLLGILAQSLVWDSWVALLAYSCLWLICVRYLRGRVQITLTGEAVVLFFGCLFALALAKLLNKTTHFFLGEGLIFLQAVRLIRPLNRKEKLTSILIACFHFGVVCTLAPNIRFILLFLGAVALFPKALEELQREEYLPHTPSTATGLTWTRYAALLSVSTILFLLLPRFFTGAPIFARDHGSSTLLDSMLDPTRGGTANSDRILLQIQGENIGYLRCYALTEFDGVRWNLERNAPLRRIRYAHESEFPFLLRRNVRVKIPSLLGRVLPTDGEVRWLDGNFFSRPVENLSGIIETSGMWNSANNFFTYFASTNLGNEPPTPAAWKKLIWHPPQSERLHQWLARASGNQTDPLSKARSVESLLRRTYSYKLGTPELSRINPVEDFIFNRTEGHCERFAAAMALFLRMQGIPSRVVIGYVPGSENPFTGWKQVRFKDAHAWAEGYFEQIGWVQFDPTPGPPVDHSTLGFSEFFEALDFAWYTHVVNFDGLAQRQFFVQLGHQMKNWPSRYRTHLIFIALAVLVLLLLWFVSRNVGRWSFRKMTLRAQPARVLSHHYGKMLHLLEQHGYHRSPSHTPHEFLNYLQEQSFPFLEEARVITETFCASHYGQKTFPIENLREVEERLRKLQSAFKKFPPAVQPSRRTAHASNLTFK